MTQPPQDPAQDPLADFQYFAAYTSEGIRLTWVEGRSYDEAAAMIEASLSKIGGEYYQAWVAGGRRIGLTDLLDLVDPKDRPDWEGPTE